MRLKGDIVCVRRSVLFRLQDIRLGNGRPQVKENNNGAVVGILTATDEDPGQKHVYTISDPTGSFEVVGNVVKVSVAANLNYEIASTYTVSITATDNGSPQRSLTKDVTIEVLDVNEAPTDVSPRKLQVGRCIWRQRGYGLRISLLAGSREQPC